MRFLPVGVLLLGGVVLGPMRAEAQDQRTLKRASKLIGPDESVEDVREGFKMISNAIRGAPNMATPGGWWMRGEAASLLAVHQQGGLGTVEAALESFREAAKAGIVDPDFSAMISLEEELRRRASAEDAEPAAAFRAAMLLVTADSVRQDLDASKPVERVRRMVLATRAAERAGELRGARTLFLDLDRQGGFIESLALELAADVEAREGPDVALRFLEDLRDRHPDNLELVKAVMGLCIRESWQDEARKALDEAEPLYGDTYEDHIALGGLHKATGDLDGAVARYRQALERAPEGYEANWHLATLLIESAESKPPPEAAPLRAEATTHLQTVLVANPQNTEALEALEALRAQAEAEPAASAE